MHTHAQEYFALEDCLGEHDRDFRACKPAMEALKRCSDEQRVGAWVGEWVRASAFVGGGEGR